MAPQTDEPSELRRKKEARTSVDHCVRETEAREQVSILGAEEND